MTEGNNTSENQPISSLEEQALIDQESILSVEQQQMASEAAEAIWGEDLSFKETRDIETQHAVLLIEALQKGEITPERVASIIGTRTAEQVIAGEKDQITGLDNYSGGRRKTQKELARSSREKTPTSAFMIDLDNFKDANDTLGHLAGNQALFAAAQHISSNTRSYDTPFRWGGDEFFVILPNTNAADAVSSVGIRILSEASASIRDQMEGMGYELSEDITFSIGVAQDIPSSDEIEAREELLTLLADKAARVSKFRGKNCITIGSIDGVNEVFSDPTTGESFTAQFESKNNEKIGKVKSITPFKKD